MPLTNPLVVSLILSRLQLRETLRKKLTLLELSPLNRVFSAALRQELKPRSHVVMGLARDVLELPPLSGTVNAFKDPYEWQSYTQLISERVVRLKKAPRTSLHPSFLITATLLSSKHSEKTLRDWIGCVGDRNWLQKYGRARMLIFTSPATAARLLAPPGAVRRGKLSIMTEQFAEASLVATTASKVWLDLQVATHQPVRLAMGIDCSGELSLIDIQPKNHVLDLESFDYVVDRLMGLKLVPLLEAVAVLGPGALEYFQIHLPGTLLGKKAIELDEADWLCLSEAFFLWPFKPEVWETQFHPVQPDGEAEWEVIPRWYSAALSG